MSQKQGRRRPEWFDRTHLYEKAFDVASLDELEKAVDDWTETDEAERTFIGVHLSLLQVQALRDVVRGLGRLHQRLEGVEELLEELVEQRGEEPADETPPRADHGGRLEPRPEPVPEPVAEPVLEVDAEAEPEPAPGKRKMDNHVVLDVEARES